MKGRLKSVVVPSLLCGAWGVIIYLLSVTVLNGVPYRDALFYPLLLAGAVLSASIFSGAYVSFSRVVFLGLVSGFIYQAVSPVFPFLASVLTGAALGGGLWSGREGVGGFLDTAVTTLRGIVIFPLLVAAGGFVSSLFSQPDSVAGWFFWGAWLGLGICLIPARLSGGKEIPNDAGRYSGLDEFKSEAGDINRELRELTRAMD